MKKATNKAYKLIRTILIIIGCIMALGGYGYYHFFCDLNAIKPGEKIAESVSPDGRYTVSAYLNNGGATTAEAVLCVLEDGKHTKNIYWNYRCDTADIQWIDEDSVSISGIILENVKKDTYDFRKNVNVIILSQSAGL